LINNYLQNSTQVLDESSFAQIQSIPETHENEKYLASLGLQAGVSAGNLPNGAKVLVLAYKKKNDNNYIFHKEHIFEVGKESDFRLDGGQNYTLLIVSQGTDNPPIAHDKTNFNYSYFSIDRTAQNGQVLYQRIDNLVPNGNIPRNKLDIRLKKRTVGVRIVLDTSEVLGDNVGRKIISIKNAKLTYRALAALNGVRFLCNSFTRVDSIIGFYEKTLNFSGNDYVKTSELIEDLMYLGESTYIIFTAEIEVEGLSKLKLSHPLNKGIKIGHKKTFRIKLQNCGAYLGPNNTVRRQFMCHNLGADYSLYPFTPSENIHGDKYQWGQKNPIILQKDDIYTGTVPNWPVVAKPTVWTINDPCPDGYRIPTKTEWEYVIKYNTHIRIGSWNSLYGKNSSAGFRVHNLMLPAAGAFNRVGEANYRGEENTHNTAYASYWSSTIYTVNSINNRNVLTVTEEEVSADADRNIHDAMPVRCIRI